MSQSLKAMIVVAALVVLGVAANQFSRSRASGVGSSCRSGLGDRRVCYTQLLSDHLTRYGVADAVATLDALASTDPDAAEHAHEYAHGIGIEAYSKYPEIVSTFVGCGDGSASGCRHGFMQAFLEGRDQVSAADLQALCRPFEDPKFTRALLFQCIHGMGHGLTMFRGHDAPKALADCDLLAQDWDRTSCYGGVFMEVFVNATSPHHPGSQLSSHSHHMATAFKAIDTNDPLYPCSIMDHRYLYSCYQIQTSVILYLNHGNIGGTARVCDRAPTDMQNSCYESLGRDVTAYSGRDPQKTADLCAKGSLQHRTSCYSGAARSLVNWTGTTEGALAFCRIVANDRTNLPDDGIDCYKALGVAIATIVAAGPDREEQCLRAQRPEAVEACRAGAGLAIAR